MIKFLFIFVMSFVLVFFVGLNIPFAQELRGTISGTVINENSSVLGAEITIVNKSANTIDSRYEVFGKIAITDASGKFTFSHIPYGVYDIKIKKDCVTFRKTDVEIKSAETVNIEVKLTSEDCKQKELEENAKWKACEESSSNKIVLLDIDKQEIFREVLRFNEDYYYFILKEPSKIIMLAETTNDEGLKQILGLPKLTIMALGIAEIKELAKKQKQNVNYISLKFGTDNSCVKVGVSWLEHEWKKRKKGVFGSSDAYCSYIFRKESGKWIGKQEFCQVV